jgi:hypothetical protein
MTISTNRGRLLHGNPGGDPSNSPRCGAKTRRGLKCKAPAMRNRNTGKYTRCRMHGGASTGPKTEEGLERCRRAPWKHGLCSAAAITERKKRQKMKRQLSQELHGLARWLRLLR